MTYKYSEYGMADAMGGYRICHFIFIVSIGISLCGGDFMKDSALTIIEHYLSHADPPNQAIYQTVTAWLTKELYK